MQEEAGAITEPQVIKWAVSLAMGISFAISFCTGLLKFTLLLRVPG
ncbi:MAG: hypothetical protein M0Q92_03155 [Methanoregula sp.]|nr:hypothetical protein [Methanoregula sp.]